MVQAGQQVAASVDGSIQGAGAREQEAGALDIKQIRYFIAIVDYGSLTKAAAHLGIAQPALSQHVSALEAECRAQLLMRNPHGVTPTEKGKVLYRHGCILLHQVEQAQAALQSETTGVSGVVSVGLPTTVTAALAIPLLRRVRELYPGIRLQLFESPSGYLVELLVTNRLDLAVLFRDEETRSICATPLLVEYLFLIGDCGLSDEMRARDRCPLSDLREIPLVLPNPTHELRQTLDSVFTREGIEANTIADIDSLPTMVAAARDDLACTILPPSALLPYDSGRAPRARQIVSPEVGRPISLCRLHNAHRPPAAIAVEDLIVALVPQLIGEGLWPGVVPAQEGGQPP